MTGGADLGQTEEREFLALDHTLLSYNGADAHFTIPNKVNDVPISRVGDGALYGCASLRALHIPGRIRQIGQQAFYGCPKLETVYLEGELPDFAAGSLTNCPNLQQIRMKDFPVPEELYQQMLEDSALLEDGRRITERFPAIPKLDLLSQALDVQRAAYVPREISTLFSGHSGRDAAELSMHEKQELFALIRSGLQPRLDPESEQSNDLQMRRASLTDPERVCLFGFERGATQAKNGIRRLSAFLLLGSFFYQSAVEIQWEGETYYLYQRRYLHNLASMKYLRRDHGIFSPEGPIEEDRLSKEIYAKYQLLSIL